MNIYYVYILQSELIPGTFYTGFTENLGSRIKEHNSGKCSHTAKYKPWKLKAAVNFTERSKALKFEKYLKTGSNRAFAKKHF